MAGGDCRITKKIEIGHLFRSKAPYRTNVCDLVYNKIYLCKTIFPEEFGEKLLGYLPHDDNFKAAGKMIEKNMEEVDAAKSYYDSIWISSIYDYCKRFGIKLP